ncbi:MAG: YCF48-related protein [Bacteroidota bacterium]
MLLFILFITWNEGKAQSGWTSVASGTNSDLYGVYMYPLFELPLSYSGPTGFAVGGNGTILETTDKGEYWYTVTSGTHPDLHAIIFREPDSGYVVGANGTILRSTNRGASWVQQASGVTVDLNSIVSSLPVSHGTNAWVCGDSGTILITINNGASWIGPVGETGTTRSLHSINMFAQIGIGTLYTCGDSGTVINSTRAGYYWNTLTAHSNFDFYSVATLEDTVWIAGTHGIVIVSTDEGNTWLIESTHVSVTLRSIFVAAPGLSPIPMFPPGDAYAVGDSGTILHSTNNGRTWVRQPSGTTNTLYEVIFTDSLTGTIVGANGTILHTNTGGVVSVRIPNGKSQLPKHYALFQNYPNPFNPSSTISYSLPQKSFVTLKLYDILGREMRTLVNAEQEPGNYSRIVDANDLPSGVYFYRLQVGNPSASSGHGFTDTKKMVLLK